MGSHTLYDTPGRGTFHAQRRAVHSLVLSDLSFSGHHREYSTSNSAATCVQSPAAPPMQGQDAASMVVTMPFTAMTVSNTKYSRAFIDAGTRKENESRCRFAGGSGASQGGGEEEEEEEQEEEEGAEEDSVLASRLRLDALGGIGPAEQHEA